VHFLTLVVVDKHDGACLEPVAENICEKFEDEYWDWFVIGGRWNNWLRTKGMSETDEGKRWAVIRDVDWDAVEKAAGFREPYYYISKNGECYAIDWHSTDEEGKAEWQNFLAVQDPDDFLVIADFHN